MQICIILFNLSSIPFECHLFWTSRAIFARKNRQSNNENSAFLKPLTIFFDCVFREIHQFVNVSRAKILFTQFQCWRHFGPRFWLVCQLIKKKIFKNKTKFGKRCSAVRSKRINFRCTVWCVRQVGIQTTIERRFDKHNLNDSCLTKMRWKIKTTHQWLPVARLAKASTRHRFRHRARIQTRLGQHQLVCVADMQYDCMHLWECGCICATIAPLCIVSSMCDRNGYTHIHIPTVWVELRTHTDTYIDNWNSTHWNWSREILNFVEWNFEHFGIVRKFQQKISYFCTMNISHFFLWMTMIPFQSPTRWPVEVIASALRRYGILCQVCCHWVTKYSVKYLYLSR